jgi:hypothetical protein
MPMPPPDVGMGSTPPAMAGQPSPAPSYGGTEALLSQPNGQQMSDPASIVAVVFRKIMDLLDATSQSFPGGEDKIQEGLQLIGLGLNEKVQRMGMPEAQGPPTVA